MRRPILPIACALALLTGAWLGQAYAFVSPPSTTLASDSNTRATEAAVWRFYDAVDLLFRTGDDSAIHETVAPTFFDHTDRPGIAPSRDGLLRYLASLRQTHPALRLAPRELLVQGDRVVAQVELAGDPTGSFLGMPLAGSTPWASVDIFRLADGRITEHWAGTRGLVATEPLFSASLAVPPGFDLIPSLERVTFAPGASDDDRTHHAPAVILAETGAIDVTTGGAITVLAPGDSVVVPGGVAVSMSNPTAALADVIILTLNAPTWPVGPGEPEAGPRLLPPGITTRLIANGASATTAPGPHVVAIGRISLGSGAQLASHQTAGTELLVVEAGTVTATFPGTTSRTWIQYPDMGSTVANNVEHLTANTGLSVSPDTVATYSNDEATALSLLIVTIAPSAGIAAEPSPAAVPAGGNHQAGS